MKANHFTLYLDSLTHEITRGHNNARSARREEEDISSTRAHSNQTRQGGNLNLNSCLNPVALCCREVRHQWWHQLHRYILQKVCPIEHDVRISEAPLRHPALPAPPSKILEISFDGLKTNSRLLLYWPSSPDSLHFVYLWLARWKSCQISAMAPVCWEPLQVASSCKSRLYCQRPLSMP